MPHYIVQFITDRDVIERTYDPPTAQDCLDHPEAHFHTWNFDHGELHEVAICPPQGCNFLAASDGTSGYERCRYRGASDTPLS